MCDSKKASKTPAVWPGLFLARAAESAPGQPGFRRLAAHALGQGLPHRLRGQLVRRLVLSSPYLRQPGDGAGRVGRRARPAPADGTQAAALRDHAGGPRTGAWAVVVVGLWRRAWGGLDAREAWGGGAGDRLPPCLRGAAAQARGRHQPAQPHLVPLVQRSAGTAVGGRRRPCRGEALLSQHKTSAWPLSGAYAALIVYASLYPFSGWRDQEIAPWEFLFAGWPKYWTGFDVAANVVGYVPLGFLLALSFMRRGHVRRFTRHPNVAAVGVAVLAGTLLSLLMEGIQNYLPSRVASNVDFGLNVGGTLIGAIAATALELGGAIDRWSRFRDRWFIAESRGALVLLALWPFALLFPAAVPLGLGQVLERLEPAVAEWLADTPFLAWLPVREIELQPLVPGAELLCVALGVIVPCLLAFSVMRLVARRAIAACVAVALGIVVTALS